MHNDIPPWGDDGGDPWKEVDLFEEWIDGKGLKYIDASSSAVLVELFRICHECFYFGKNDETLDPNDDLSELPDEIE
jgi:hypothetical protein